MQATLFFGGPILTLAGPPVQALLVAQGRVQAVGGLEELRAGAPEPVQMVDLQGNTLMPAFIDAHSHITALASTLSSVDLTDAQSLEEVARRVRAFVKERALPPGRWVTGFGYDQNRMQEHRHPDRALLDAACPEHPLVVTHASGHMGVMNSLALRIAQIDGDTPDPAGGKIGRDADGTPNGYLEESAFTSRTAMVPPPGEAEQLELLDRAQQVYLRHGVTTVQDGLTKDPQWANLRQLAQQDRLLVDTVCYADLKDHRELYLAHRTGETYRQRLRMGGYKIFLDGSPQGRTAWMSQPYEKGEKGYCGYPIYTDEQVLSMVKTALSDEVQLLAHCNGDAAAEQMITCYERALAEMPKGPSLRPVMIHAQLVRPDQLARMGRMGMMASFFVAHTYYWGDVHLENFGQERALDISPVRAAVENQVRYTFHQDTPVLPPDMLDTLWCATNRVTRKGVVLDAAQRATPAEALAGVTTNAAYQYGELDHKGTLQPGKLADLVILSGDPLTTDPAQLKRLRVLATLKEGVCRYRAQDAPM